MRVVGPAAEDDHDQDVDNEEDDDDDADGEDDNADADDDYSEAGRASSRNRCTSRGTHRWTGGGLGEGGNEKVGEHWYYSRKD